MVSLVCIVINCIILFLSYIKRKDIFCPVVVLNFMWLFVHMLNFALGWNSNEIEYLILGIPSIAFSIGFSFFSRKKKALSDIKDEKYTFSKIFSIFLILIVISIFIYMTIYFIRYIKVYYSSNLWFTLRRIAWFENPKNNPLFKYTSSIVYVLPAIFLFSFQADKSCAIYMYFATSLIIAIVWSLYTTSRTATFLVISILILSQVSVLDSENKMQLDQKLKRKINKKAKKLFIILIVAMGIVFLYIAMKKNPDAYGDISKLEFFVRNIANYSNVSSAAFVEWYKRGFTYTYGTNSFRFLYAFLQRFGFDVGTVNVNYGGLFIEIENYSTNAFTVARNYVQDFGILYMAFVLCVFGIIHGWVYGKVINSRGLKLRRYSLLNSMLFVPLFYQILTDQYLNVLSQWIQLTFWICLFTSNRFWKRI